MVKKASESNPTSKQPSEFQWEALAHIEQQVIWELYSARCAINSMQVYFRLATRVIRDHEDGKLRMRTVANIRSIPVEETGGMFIPAKKPKKPSSTSIETDKETIDLATLDRRKAEEIVAGYRKDGVQIPAYTTIIRVLNGFVGLGWVSKREEALGRSATLFFLPSPIREKLMKSNISEPSAF